MTIESHESRLQKFAARNKNIVRLRRQGKAIGEIGKIERITRERVYQILKRAGYTA